MSERRLALPAGSDVGRLARAIEQAGGCLVVVGGFVRDALAGRDAHDLDLEVFGLGEDAVEAVLVGFGFSTRVGRQFPIWRRGRDGLDLAYPRAGALDYHASDPGSLESAFRAASRHRDLTINALGWAPLPDAIVDPWGGREDLRARRLRAVDRETFAADPLRLLRVARLQAVLGAEVDEALVATCRALDLADVPVERIAGELRRMLLDGAKPSRGFAWLARIGRLDVFAPVEALVGVPQDPVWHPEGDVFVHTLLVLDVARSLAAALGAEDAERLMLAALCHDLGKPTTTTREGERVRSIAHEAESARGRAGVARGPSLSRADGRGRRRARRSASRAVPARGGRRRSARLSPTRTPARRRRRVARGARAPGARGSAGPNDAGGALGPLRGRRRLPRRRGGRRRSRGTAPGCRHRPRSDGARDRTGPRARSAAPALSRARGRDRGSGARRDPRALSRGARTGEALRGRAGVDFVEAGRAPSSRVGRRKAPRTLRQRTSRVGPLRSGLRSKRRQGAPDEAKTTSEGSSVDLNS
ncbi:MAG: HD domain-containing protein [Deltaproteobacteria bacterium]|nr:HD domain-containing protein [Deltaproteobacteria bacterium]